MFLNREANFSTKIGHDVFWVPVNELGKPEYSMKEIMEVIRAGKSKRGMFRSLYDIVQLFLLSNFTYIMDIDMVVREEIIWETHEDVERVLKKNAGCCASVASWMNYYLEGMYEKCGYFTFNRPNGSGHVMNYIYHNGWYYLIDMTPYVINEEQTRFYETGSRLDYIRSRNITGILAKCKELKDYALFYDRIQTTKGYHFIYFMHQKETIPPIAIIQREEHMDIVYPEGYEVQCIFNGAPDFYRLRYEKYANP